MAQPMRMFRLGVTGGIAGGKSHACQVLGRMGAYVLDADKLAHQEYAAGTALNRKIAEVFGGDVMVPSSGEVDRRRLGQLVFEKPDQLKLLESLVWPAVTARIRSEMANKEEEEGCKWLVLEAAMLLQASWKPLVDEVWCFYTSPEVSKARVMMRNNLSEKEAEARIQSQPPTAFYLEHANVAIDTSGPKERTIELIEKAVADLRVRLRDREGGGFILPGKGGEGGRDRRGEP